MSAQIPSTMLLSDLLKATGYDCPEELQGKTFEEATAGGDSKISTNTDKTIDVSSYTEPVVVEPAEGYDATKKVTVTLENIPTPGYTKLYHWENSTLVKGVYTTTSTPTTSDTAFDIQSATYARKAITSATTTKLVIGGYDYSRHSAGDIDLTV